MKTSLDYLRAYRDCKLRVAAIMAIASDEPAKTIAEATISECFKEREALRQDTEAWQQKSASILNVPMNYELFRNTMTEFDHVATLT